MLKTIVEKEIRDLIGSNKFAITFAACAFLILAAFYVGAARYELYRGDYETAVAENLHRLEGITDWNVVGDTKVFLPPTPLSMLVSGVSNDIDRIASLGGRGEPITSDSRYSEDPIYAVFRFFDLEFLFTVVLSLFAILLGYDAISGEKERGTLRLTFANALARHTYILGKAIGSALVLGLSLLTTIGIAVLLLPLLGVSLSGEEWFRLGLIVSAGFLYLGAFLMLSICVSSLTHRSSASFLILLVIWISSVLIVPRVSVEAAGRAVEVPSVDEIAAQKAGYSRQLRDEFIDGLGQVAIRVNMSDPSDDPTARLTTIMDSLMDIRETKMGQLSARLNEDRHNRQRIQSRLAFALARISPTASFTLAISSLANTSIALKDRFYRESQAHSDVFGEFKKEKTGMNAGRALRVVKHAEGGDEEEEQPKPIDPRELPQFTYSDLALAESLQVSVPDIGFLAIFDLLFLAGALVAFRRYDVR